MNDLVAADDIADKKAAKDLEEKKIGLRKNRERLVHQLDAIENCVKHTSPITINNGRFWKSRSATFYEFEQISKEIRALAAKLIKEKIAKLGDLDE